MSARILGGLIASLLVMVPAYADEPKAQPSGLSRNSKEPIHIEADGLEVFDKEGKAVYTGNVIVTQGATTMKAKTMVIFYVRADDAPSAAASQTPAAPKAGSSKKAAAAPAPVKPVPADAATADEASSGDTSIKRVDAEGDVMIIDKDQIASGDKGVYEAATDIMTMTGNVTLSKGKNVTKGQKLVYNLGTGIATVDAGNSGRVSSTFIQGEKKPDALGKTPAQ